MTLEELEPIHAQCTKEMCITCKLKKELIKAQTECDQWRQRAEIAEGKIANALA